MSDPKSSPEPELTRDELVALVARVHQGSAYAESTLAGRTLAAQSRLPKLVAENLGAGFGQWDFFPEPAEIVDFALAYRPPSTRDELWSLVRTWASDDAGARHTLMALVGREIIQHELRRIDVPELHELLGATRQRQLELRASLGLEVPAKAQSKVRKKAAAGQGDPPRSRASQPAGEVPARMPKPALRPRPKAAPAPAPRRFRHSKFGEGVLQSQDGAGDDAKLTIAFAGGTKTLLARYVTELVADSEAPSTE